jgi:hypothetical protein
VSEYDVPDVVPIWVNEDGLAEQLVLVVDLKIWYTDTPAPTLLGTSHDTASFQFEVDLIEISARSMLRGMLGAEPEYVNSTLE